MKSANSNPNQPHPWLTLPTRFSGWVLLLSLALVTAATFGGKNLYFRGDYNIFLTEKTNNCSPMRKYKPLSPNPTTSQSSFPPKRQRF